MSVDSYIELFTTLYGWLFYNIIWDVLVTSGAVLLPFIGIVIDNVLDAYQENEPEDAARVALRTIEIEVIIAFIVITLAGNPFFTFQASEVSYTPPDLLETGAPEHATTTAAVANYSTYATISFVGHPNSVEIPPWWYGVSQFGSGINRAIMEGIPPKLNFREYINRIDTMKIEDPLLKQQLNDFYRDCFVPARSKYYEEKPTSVLITSLMTQHGADDVDWLGSRVYLSLPGYYNAIRPMKLIKPFPYSPLRDTEWDAAVGDDLPVYGRPTCLQWWGGISGTVGLKDQLILELTEWDLIMAAAELGFGSVAERQDVLIKKLLSLGSDVGVFVPRGYDMAYENKMDNGTGGHFIERITKGLTTAVGVSVMGLLFGIFLDIFLRAAPMIQALLLMGLTALLPFLLVISRYKLSILMGGALAWFSIKFWTVLWYMAYWVDQSLIMAMFPDPGAMTMVAANLDYNNRVILNVVTGMMYLIFPLIFTMIMSIAGFSAGRQLDGMKSMAVGKIEGGASSVGRAGGKLAGKAK
jgi:hypothetical protein